MSKKLFDIQQEITIKNIYLSGVSASSIAKSYNASSTAIHGVLKRLQVQKRNSGFHNRKHHLNDKFFEIIDNPAKAQVLGMFFADGYNNRKHFSVVLSLQICDKEYLEKINNILEYDRPLTRDKNCYRLVITRQKVSDDLDKLGCVQAKSFIVQFPINHIPEHLIKYFLLGFFEGNGNLYCNKKRNYYSLDIHSGSKNFLEEIKSILKKSINIDCTIKPRRKIYRLRIASQHNIFNFLNWMYQDCVFRLERKYEIFLNLAQKIKDIGQSGRCRRNRSVSRWGPY
mgnify:CR=1 FL=1